MAWIELHEAVRDHWKIQRLADSAAVRYAEAEGWVTNLWLWAITSAKNGDLDRFTNMEIARGARCEVQPENFVAWMIDSGLITSQKKINDWRKYGIKKMEQNRKRIEAHRRKNVTLQKRDSNVTVTPTVPNRTVPNQTIPNLTKREEQKQKIAAPNQPPPVDQPKPPKEPKPFWHEYLDHICTKIQEKKGLPKPYQPDGAELKILSNLYTVYTPETVMACWDMWFELDQPWTNWAVRTGRSIKGFVEGIKTILDDQRWKVKRLAYQRLFGTDPGTIARQAEAATGLQLVLKTKA
ncbi:MAG: hypothetical protein HY548_07165 [Elusimicrobia bacterium]|nr:hypothetical protein [Elusimicrobiota bacterium]